MTCCFIGHRKIKNTPSLRERLRSIVLELIKNGYICFIFGDHSEFDELCHEEVTKLKEAYPDIRRISYRVNYEEADDYTMSFLLKGYEESVFPDGVKNSGRASYIKRNYAMIDSSEVCVFYYDKNYSPSGRKSGTQEAYNYAVKKKKRLVNLYN